MPTQIAEYSQTEAALQELRSKYQNKKFDVTTPTGMAEAKKVRGELRTYRTDLEKRRVEIKAPALERCRLIDDEAKRITIELEALEKPIASQIKAEEDRVAAERQAKIDAENLRRTTIQGKIQKFRLVAGAMVNKTSAEIEETIGKVMAAVVDEPTYNEFLKDAEEARQHAVDSLREMLIKVQEAEAEQTRIAAERAELDELRKKQAELQKQIDEQNRVQNERLAVEQQRVTDIKNKIWALREVYVDPIMTSSDVERLVDKCKSLIITAEEYHEFTEEAFSVNQKTITNLCEIHADLVNKENEAARIKQEQENNRRIAEEQQAEQRRLDEEREILEREQCLAKERELAEAERTKKLLAAKKDTPVAALVEILALCREGLKPEVALAHIEVIAEANITESVPKPKRIRGAK